MKFHFFSFPPWEENLITICVMKYNREIERERFKNLYTVKTMKSEPEDQKKIHFRQTSVLDITITCTVNGKPKWSAFWQ